MRWADDAEEAGAQLRLMRDGRAIEIEFVQADLAGGAGHVLRGANLVTAAALFDLVSEDWLRRFVARSRARTPFYTVLTYDGVETWSPADARDADMLAAFHAHQARDKGFGPAAGPRATALLARMLAARGYAVEQGASPWRLDASDARMIEALANGVADACAETGLVKPDVVAGWRAARVKAEVEIGHVDLFAYPA